MKKNNIYLIGPMGSGKTSVGSALATLTGFPFYDSDSEIEKQCGLDIPTIFAQHGEAAFRRHESQVIESLCQFNPIILSVGGGAVLTDSNRFHLSENGIVIHLTALIDTL